MIATPDTSPETTREKEVSVQAYTVEQVAEILQIGRDKVYELIRTGHLHSIKIGRLRRITDQHLADFIASLEETSSR
jgi:excisionase family DNA binding protein